MLSARIAPCFDSHTQSETLPAKIRTSFMWSPMGKPVESPSAVRHVDELMSSRSGPKGLHVERPVAPLGSADSLRELLDLMARHPARLA